MNKSTWILGLMISTATASVVFSCNNKDEKIADQQPASAVSNDSMVKHGAYLVTIMGCDDCHSPKIMGAHGPEVDMNNRLSGHPAKMPLGPVNPDLLKSWVLFNPINTAVVGPWGVSFAANITSSETGIGKWTESQFFKAIREGKSKGLDGGRMMLPPMPWQNIAKATDEDIKALFAYLKSTRPINNAVPAPIAPDKLAMLSK